MSKDLKVDIQTTSNNIANSQTYNIQKKCPQCGSTDIGFKNKNGLLTCNFCRHEFISEKLDIFETNLLKLQGEKISPSAQNIEKYSKDIVTLKCSNCGAEVVINASETTQARCHWCRNFLSINNKISNGSLPDLILPFKVTKEEAKNVIEERMKKNKKLFKIFSTSNFQKSFNLDNIVGVYLPYILVDINSSVDFSGYGEHTNYIHRNIEPDKPDHYYIDVYKIERKFDLTIHNMPIIANKDKLYRDSTHKNDVIDGILPFDTNNCVKFDVNYLKGFSSEKRNMNIDEIKNVVNIQSKDIARYATNNTLIHYDRGVRWDDENVDIKGVQYKTAYLPIWLYTHKENNKEFYIAVNGRTEECLGAVPQNKFHYFLFIVLILLLMFNVFAIIFIVPIILLALFVWKVVSTQEKNHPMYVHNHERETTKHIFNLKKDDKLIKKGKHVTYSEMKGANNKKIDYKRTNGF